MDSVDGLDAILIEQALNYHGEELQKVWDETRGKDELSVLLGEKPNFEVYEQREKTLCQSDNEKRQRLQKFIAKKADILFSKSNLEKSMEPVSQYVDHEVAYGTMPGLDSFIKIDKSQRVRNFLESLITGDIIYTQVMGKSSMGLLLKVLCNCSACPRVVPELTVKALILNTCTVPAVDKNGVTREYMVDDLVCVCVKEVNVDAERIIASMNITPREGLIPHPPLGLIDSSELPDIYRRLVENKGEFFESILENSPGFCNPNNTKYLSDLLLLGQDNHSHMIGLRDGFPLDEYSVKLRQIQSSKWAFRYVTDGIDHFQEGRNSEAFKCLNKALLIDPLNEEGLVARGCLHTTNGKLDKAVDDFEMAIKLNQTHVSARKYLLETLVALGRNYEDEKEFDKALEVFNKCLTIDPCHEIAKNEIEYLKLGGMEEDEEHSVQVLNTLENQNDSQNPTTKLDKKKQKRRKITRKKRKCSSSSSSSSSDSSQSESSTSSSSSESRSSTSSSSHKKSLDSKNRASLSPLSKRMSMYDILPETNDDLLDLEGPREIGSEDDTKDYELKVRKFLDKSKDDSDYEDKVRIFFKTAARWKMEREEEKKQNNEKIKKKKRKERKSRVKDEKREKLYKKEDRKKYKSRRRKFENNGMSPLQDLQKGNSNHPYFANHDEESQLFYQESRISPQSTSTSSDKYRNANDSRHKNEINKAWDDFSIDSSGGKHKNYSYENESNNPSNPQKQMRNHHSQQIASPKERTAPKEIFEKQFENKNNLKSFEFSQNNVNGNSHSPDAFARGMNDERYFNRLRSRSCSSSSSQSSKLRFTRRSRSRSFSIRSRKSGSFERKYSRSISRSYSRSPPKYRSKSFSRSRSRSPRSEERKYRYKQQQPPPPHQQQRAFNNRGGRYNSRFQGHNSNFRGGHNGNRFHNGQDNRFNNRRGMPHKYNNHNPNYRGRGNQSRGGRFFHNNRQGYNRKHFPQERQSFSQEKEFYPQDRISYSQERNPFAQKKHFYSQDMPPNSRKFNQSFNNGEENQEGGF